MSNQILLKRTATQGKVPTTSDIAIGEVGLNTYDGKMYMHINNGVDSIIQVGAYTYSGDVSGSVSGDAVTLTLATVNSNTGSFGDSTHVGAFTVNGKGLVTAASSVAITFPVTSVFGRTGAITLLSSDISTALGYTPLSGNETITLSGDVSGSGTTAITTTLATIVDGGSGTFLKFTRSSKGLVTGTTAVGSSDITTALGYTPVNKAGDTMTGLLILSGDPSVALGAATKQYVDNAIAGLSWKEAVTCATTANITLSGLQSIDGHTTVDGERVLVKNQTNATQNGIYVAGTGTWTRSIDADANAEFQGLTVYVDQGTTQANTGWTQTTSGAIVVGTTNIVFSQFTGAGTYTAGTGLTLTGNAFSITNTTVTAGSGYNTFSVNAQGQVTLASTTAYLTGNQTITCSGDATGSGTTAITLTLANSGVTAGTYNNSATAVTPFTVDAKGRVTATGAAVTITPSFSSITSKPTTVAGYGITDINSVYAPTLTGTGASGTWGISITGTAANATSLGGTPAASYALLASPSFTGTPTAPTAPSNTNTTQIATTAFVLGQAGTSNPIMDGTVAVGTSYLYSRQDHIHPTDTSRAPVAGSSSIVTVGTITSGTWNGSTVATGYGGTGLSSIGSAYQILGVNSGATGLEYKTVSAGSGVSVTNGTGTLTITNTGVTSNVAGSGIGVSSATGTVTISNTGVLSAVAGSGISVSSATGNITFGNTGVLSFNTRTGVVTLTSTDVTTALGFSPVNKAGDTMTGLLVLSGDPTVALGAATKQYVDNAVAGLSWKESVKVATTANITLSGTQTIDGVAVIAGDRVLVKNQTTASQNGIYVVAAGAWGRATDATTSAQVAGMAVYVDQGTTLNSTGWTESVSGPIIVGTTNLTFSQFTGANTYTAGTGLTLTGNTFSITNTAVTAGSGYNTFSVNAQGQVTAASTTAYLTGNQTITCTGDATGSGTTSIPLTLANSGVVAGTYNTDGSKHYPITVNAKGLITSIGTAVNLTVPFSQVTTTPTTTVGYGITDAMIVGQVIDGGTF
jgi:hypothetical protein